MQKNMNQRSYLFVPGDRPERFDKALASGAHAVILDLEDAVSPERKAAAREAVREWLGHTGERVILRVNPASTTWFEDDCALLASGAVRGVMLPKSERHEELRALAQRLSGNQILIPLVETVSGFFQMASIAGAPRVQRLAFGSFDFMSDSGIQGDGAELDAVRTQFVLHSRHAGLLAPIDGVSLATHDVAQLEADVRRSRRWGFGAKLCIHPSQVSAVHQGFAPTQAETAWARKVVQALASGPLGAIAVDGKLVDKPVAMLAQSILDEAQAS